MGLISKLKLKNLSRSSSFSSEDSSDDTHSLASRASFSALKRLNSTSLKRIVSRTSSALLHQNSRPPTPELELAVEDYDVQIDLGSYSDPLVTSEIQDNLESVPLNTSDTLKTVITIADTVLDTLHSVSQDFVLDEKPSSAHLNFVTSRIISSSSTEMTTETPAAAAAADPSPTSPENTDDKVDSILDSLAKSLNKSTNFILNFYTDAVNILTNSLYKFARSTNYQYNNLIQVAKENKLITYDLLYLSAASLIGTGGYLYHKNYLATHASCNKCASSPMSLQVAGGIATAVAILGVGNYIYLRQQKKK